MGAKENYFNYDEEHKEGLDPKGKMRIPMGFGEFGDLAKFGMHHIGSCHCKVG